MASRLLEVDLMNQNLEEMLELPCLRMEAELRPAQGSRFQPTGFPDLGPATFTRPDGTQMLLVESSQSMANRMEMVCWSEEKSDLVDLLQGMPYVRIELENEVCTSSILDAHRLNSPYILEGKDKSFHEVLKEEFSAFNIGPVDYRKVARTIFRHDPNSLVHGVFIAKKDLGMGRIRLPRMLSAFIEALGVTIAESGGVKLDNVNPKGEASRGFGHVPYPRTEFTAEKITAYFSLDTSQLAGYSLELSGRLFLLALSLWKIRKFLEGALRLRTACDLELVDFKASKSNDAVRIPVLSELEGVLPSYIKACTDEGLFASPPITRVIWRG